MNHEEVRPPEWPMKLLRFFLKEKYLEEIEGDMEEIFLANVTLASTKIRCLYWITIMMAP